MACYSFQQSVFQLICSIRLFSDAPFSLTYRIHESTLASPFDKLVRLSVDVLAYPRKVSFQWYFKAPDTDWKLITTSDIFTVNINGQRTMSELIINKLILNLTGRFRLDASNGINGVKQFNFTVKAQGGVNYWFYKSNKHVNQIQTFTTFNR